MMFDDCRDDDFFFRMTLEMMFCFRMTSEMKFCFRMTSEIVLF